MWPLEAVLIFTGGAQITVNKCRSNDAAAEDLRANYQLGLVYAKLGDNEAAKRMFARADDLRGKQRNQESVVLKLIDPPQ